VKRAHFAELLALAAIWGASFLLMRVSAEAFGPFALAAVRVAGAVACLVPLLVWRRQLAALRGHWPALIAVGLANSALPFLLYAYAALSIPVGLLSVFNATTPLFGALIARVWLGDRLSASRITGLAIGFGGVAWLIASRGGLSTQPGDGSVWALVACLMATLGYGISASVTKRYLGGVPPMAVAAGSQIPAAVVLMPLALFAWPTTPPSATAWVCAGLLAVVCTGLAYVMYFRLIANAGPANAMSVTFLIPLFAMVWGYFVLNEHVSTEMLIGCAAILAGTGLTTGLVSLPWLRATSQNPP
jgi:drug/metabolite transporter (DMT)-like permease